MSGRIYGTSACRTLAAVSAVVNIMSVWYLGILQRAREGWDGEEGGRDVQVIL